MNVNRNFTAIAVLASLASLVSLVSQATVASNFTKTVNMDMTTLLSGDTAKTTDSEGASI
ncbi:Uncharacterised protein [Yersinia frederiksenii]|nr:Uncharacterised protein [Yersinia frederiksenii]